MMPVALLAVLLVARPVQLAAFLMLLEELKVLPEEHLELPMEQQALLGAQVLQLTAQQLLYFGW